MYPIILKYDYDLMKISVIETYKKYDECYCDVMYKYDKDTIKQLCLMTHFLKMFKKPYKYTVGDIARGINFYTKCRIDNHMDSLYGNAIVNIVVYIIEKLKEKYKFTEDTIYNVPCRASISGMKKNDKPTLIDTIMSVGLMTKKMTNEKYISTTIINFHNSQNKIEKTRSTITKIHNESVNDTYKILSSNMPEYRYSYNNDKIFHVGKFVLVFFIKITLSEDCVKKCDIVIQTKEIELKYNATSVYNQDQIIKNDVVFVDTCKAKNIVLSV